MLNKRETAIINSSMTEKDPLDIQLPLVTVCIASYNYEQTLGQALHSVMKQSYPRFEVLVIDDGSRDRSLDVLRVWQENFPKKIRVLTHAGGANLGLVKTYQLAFRESRGKYTAFLEADDVWHENFLRQKIEILENSADVGVIYSMYKPFGEKYSSMYWEIYQCPNALGLPGGRAFDAFTALLMRNPVASFSNFVVRTHLLSEIRQPAEDELFYDWWVLAHLAQQTRFYYQKERLTMWRIHSGSANYSKFNWKQLRTLQDFLLRLYASLKVTANGEQMNAIVKEERKINKYRELTVANRMTRLLYECMKEPVQSIRFALHIFLKNLFFRKPRTHQNV